MEDADEDLTADALRRLSELDVPQDSVPEDSAPSSLELRNLAPVVVRGRVKSVEGVEHVRGFKLLTEEGETVPVRPSVRVAPDLLRPGREVLVLGGRNDRGEVVAIDVRPVESDPSPSPEEMVAAQELSDDDPLEACASVLSPRRRPEPCYELLALLMVTPVGGAAASALFLAPPRVARAVTERIRRLSPQAHKVNLRSASSRNLRGDLTVTETGWRFEAGVPMLANDGLLIADGVDPHDPKLLELLSLTRRGVIPVSGVRFGVRCSVICALESSPDEHPALTCLKIPGAALRSVDLILWPDPYPERVSGRRIREEDVRALLKCASRVEGPRCSSSVVRMVSSRASELSRASSWGPSKRRIERTMLLLARAHARLRLSDRVEEEDVRRVSELMSRWIERINAPIESIFVSQ